VTEPYQPKLIEVALPLMKINAESAREKSIRHGHPSTLHLWWARRPLAAARAVLWASLVDDPSAHPDRFPTREAQQAERDRLFDILERLIPWEASTDKQVLAEAYAEVEKCFSGDVPPILDPFGGGGSIPLEAQRLGLEAMSGDLNPVAVLIQRAMLEVPARFAALPPVTPDEHGRLTTWSGAQGLAVDVEAHARWMAEEARRLVGDIYPEVTGPTGESMTPIAWITVRTVESPDPSWSGHVPLAGSWILVKKPGKPTIWVEPMIDSVSQVVRYEVRTGGSPPEGTIGRGGGTCVATGAPIPLEYVRSEAQAGRMGTAVIAIVAEAARGRAYLPPDESLPRAPAPPWTPSGRLPHAGLGFRVQKYGMTEWADLFTSRQLATLTTFADLVERARVRVEHDARAAGLADDQVPLSKGGNGAFAYSEAVATYLAFAVDRCTARWTHLAIWNSARETAEHVFRMQTIQMNWVFVEVNPFSSSTGNWLGQADWVVKCLRTLPARPGSSVEQRDARARVEGVGHCVVSTDPPYYDNVGYADLSDFYFVWLRRMVGKIWPDECATLLTPKAEELVADPDRYGTRADAVTHFETGMREVLAAIRKAQDPRVPATIYYAFKQAESTDEGRSSTGWETFLQALIDAGLVVTATWPVRTEMPGGVRNFGRNSLASSVVLACRPRPLDAPLESRGGFVERLRAELPADLRVLQEENIAPVDLAQSAIGPGMRVFSRYAKVIEADGSAMGVRSALALINDVLGEVMSEEEAELDADTRFALTWFEQFGHNPGPYGDADVLARAKDTSVSGVLKSGIASSRDQKLRLLERDELPDGWDPTSDSRLTVWEATQHLIRRLSQSESEAAGLLSQLGGVADRARQLAYLLYGVCERKGWAEEGISYNGLITAWPELTRQAAAADRDPDQQTLI
jgi:putative DNA methylase